MLEAAGWAVQDAKRINLARLRGVAVREFVARGRHGRADYLLFVDRQAVGVIEAKPEGATLTGVEWQSAKYLDGLPDWVTSALEGALPFAYQSTGVETRFTNTLDPEARSRQVFWFHRPETLAALDPRRPREPARHRRSGTGCRTLPELNADGLWPAQATRDPQPRALARREPAPRADPDGDRLWQDVHGGERRLSRSSSTPTPAASSSSSTAPTSAARR